MLGLSTADRRLAVRLALTGVVIAAGLAALVPTGVSAAACRQIKAANEPPCNPALPDSPWGVSHRNSYAQASSPYPGLANSRVTPQHLTLPGIPVQLQFSNAYRDGGIAVWGSLINSQDTRAVFKVDHRTGRLIDTYVPSEREANPPKPEGGGITGSYSLLDRDGHFIVPRQKSIDVFGDSVKGDRSSRIRLVKRYTPAPAHLLPRRRPHRRRHDDLRRVHRVRDRAGRRRDDPSPARPHERCEPAHDLVQRIQVR